MNTAFKNGLSILFVVLLTASQAFSFFLVDDKQDLDGLADGFAIAMVKKDKAWMEANFTNACVTITQNGETPDKALTIKAFCGEVYDIKKSSADNKSFMVAGADAGGSADYTVEGITKPAGEIIDITGTYKLSFKFRKADKGWQISEILINGN